MYKNVKFYNGHWCAGYPCCPCGGNPWRDKQAPIVPEPGRRENLKIGPGGCGDTTCPCGGGLYDPYATMDRPVTTEKTNALMRNKSNRTLRIAKIAYRKILLSIQKDITKAIGKRL